MEYIFLSGEVGREIALSSTEQKFKELPKDTKEVTIYINTYGGDAFEGIAIYNYLKLKQKDVEVTTISTGMTASAGTIMFMAGNKSKRQAYENSSFLIHGASTMSWGNVSDIEKTASELKVLNEQIASIYVNETGLTKDEILNFMTEDTMRSAEWLLEKGFISEVIELKAVASLRKNNFKNNNTMAKISDDDKNWFKSLFAKMEKKFSPKNKLVQDAAGVDLDFYELEDGDSIEVGAKAKVDGSDADGDYTMPSGDVYTFASGVLETITEKTEDIGDEMQALKDENEKLKEQLQTAATAKQDTESKLEAKEQVLNTLKDDFKDLKTKVTSSFEWDGKKKKKEEAGEKVRKIFKDKK